MKLTHTQAVWGMVAVAAMWSIAGVVTRQLESAARFEITFWRSLFPKLSLLVNRKLRVKVATLSQIAELLKKTEQSQRVLEEVTEGFTLDVVGDEDSQDETLSIDRLTAAGVAAIGFDTSAVRVAA